MKKRQLKFTRRLAAGLVAVMFALMTVNIGDTEAADSDGQWVLDSVGWWYQYADGTYPKDANVTIDGKRYAFDENGYMRTGWIKYDTGARIVWRYADASGAWVSGWRQIDGKWYYFSLGGDMAANTWVDGKYYVDASGAWADKSKAGQWVLDATGWWYQRANGSYPRDGVYFVEGVQYAFDENGYMVTGWYQRAVAPGSSSYVWCYFDESGHMVKGWRQINNIWYYFADTGVMCVNGWWDGYYLDENGAWQPSKVSYESGQWMRDAVGWWYQRDDGKYPTDQFAVINNRRYYFDANGYMQTGWIYRQGVWYYADDTGALVWKGWRQINGKWYYFREAGNMARNTIVDGYYVDQSGAWTQQPVYAR